MADTWTFKKSIKLVGNETLSKLVQFYVWETPVPSTSQKGRTFKELGWRSHNFHTLQAAMRRASKLDRTRWIGANQKTVMEKLKELDRLDKYDCSFEFAIHTVKGGLNKTEALFYLIRNGFAHGGFRICRFGDKRYYVFESKDRGRLKGRAILREKTLLSWMKIVKAGPKRGNGR